MGGERGGQGVGRERVTPETDASTHCQSRSYGATKALGTAAATAERDEAVSWRRGLRQQHAEESSLLRRLLSSIGVLALFAFAVATANYRRLETGQHGATPIKTSFDRVSGALTRLIALFRGSYSHSLLVQNLDFGGAIGRQPGTAGIRRVMVHGLAGKLAN